jgi:hypothetical protein
MRNNEEEEEEFCAFVGKKIDFKKSVILVFMYCK